MSKLRNTQKKAIREQLEEDDELHIELEPKRKLADDEAVDDKNQTQIMNLLEAMTRIGGEVCRMRSEVDSLLEQNAAVIAAFDKLRSVIEEKGNYSLDDFELACEVLEVPDGQLKLEAVRKIAH